MEEFLIEDGSVTILLFCFLLTLTIVSTFGVLEKVTVNIQGNRKRAIGR